MEALFRKNALFPQNTGSNRDKEGNPTWGGYKKRIMMSLAYAIAFLCLLRLDEVLNIKVENIQVLDLDTGKTKLVLSFRKTRQGGSEYPGKSRV